MKNLFFVMAAVAALLTSCSKDDTFGGPTRGKVTFEVSTPELATRYGEGTTATNLQYAVYDMVEDATNGALVKEGNATLSGLKATVTIDLVEGREYSVIFWADAGANSPYTFSADDKTVSYTNVNNLTANNEAYDAFFAYVPEDKVKVGQVVNVDLKRPFAQLNIATNDTQKAKDLGVEVANTAVTVAGVYTSFNLATGEVQGQPTTVTFASALKANGTIGTAPNTYDLLSMNYVLVNSEKLVDVTFNFSDTNGKTDYVRTYSDVHVQRNYCTNIIGAILTDPTKFDVEIKPGVDGTYNEERGNSRVVSNAQSLQEAINDPDVDVIVFDSNINLNDLTSTTIYDNSAALSTTTRAGETSYGLLIPAGKIITLDLNGFTISQEKAQTAAYNMIQNQGTLTIMDSSANGGGKISYKDAGNGGEYVSNTIQNSGTLTIEAGTIENNSVENVATNGYPHPIDNSGKLIINGGTFDNNANYSSMRIWCTTDDDTEVTINGGTFYGSIDFQTVDRSANKGTLTINGGQFNADEHCGAAVRLLGFGTDVDEMNGYINGGEFNGVIKLGKYVDGEFNSQVFHISGGTFHDASVFNFLSDSAEEINITMAADMEVPITSFGSETGGSGEYKLGGENTKKITIDLNSHKLNITTTYMSSIGANNNDALFTIKNGTMTSSGNSDNTWNIYDLIFANCNYVIENVEFDKAIAFANADKSASLKNVTINETHDYYAMWIEAVGQKVTIDGLTINSAGRGIKIADQYVDSPAKVTLNVKNSSFETASKAAVLVTSTAGAEINWGEGNDISKVAKDKVWAVWVDEERADYADAVVVNGALVRVEGEIPTEITTDSAEVMAGAIAAGVTTINLEEGTYIIPASAQGKAGLTIKGTDNPEDVKVGVTKVGTGGENCDYGFDGSTATLENVTITTNSSTYIGYARFNGTYKNCIINGTYTLYGDSVFEDCTFNVSGDVYNIWTWGAPTATFTRCTFNCDGKAMLLYGTANTKLTMNDCIFNDKGGLTDLKAAIEIGNDYDKSYELIVNNATVNGFEINDKGINTGTTLWANKNSMGTDKLNVVVDGVDVY